MGIPVLTLVGVLGFSVNYLSKASESTFLPGKYYENSDNSKDTSKDDGGDNKDLDTEVAEQDNLQFITDHDDVILDTDPNSITVLVNKEISLPSDYIPADLVVPDIMFSFDYEDEKQLMRIEAAEALEDLFASASSEGLALRGVSAYRSYERQYEIFTNNVKVKGLDHTTKYSAVPGYSEHQTGLSIDVSAKACNYRLDASFAKTKESQWLIQNAHLFGYIIRYAEDKTAITGYSYEPWHIRYVGKTLATYLYENNLCLEEYYNYIPTIDYTDAISYDNLESYGIDPDDVKVPTKAPTSTPTPSPTPELTPVPSDVPTLTPIPSPTKKPEITITGTPTPTPSPMIDNGQDLDGDGNTEGDADGNTDGDADGSTDGETDGSQVITTPEVPDGSGDTDEGIVSPAPSITN